MINRLQLCYYLIMNNTSSFASFTAQQAVLDKLKNERPELLLPQKQFDESGYLPQIGITGLSVDRPAGYLRYYPQDFIVEEVLSAITASQIEPDDTPPQRSGKKPTLYADLVKVGISSLEALDRLSAGLNLHSTKLGYAGIKDSNALTSQRVSFSKSSYEEIKDKKIDGLFLTRFSYEPGRVVRSNLLGNKFTILVRTKEKIERDWLTKKMSIIKKDGFLNYYQVQRFGGDKLVSHLLGREILRKDYENAVKTCLLFGSDYEIKLAYDLRQEAAKHYGDWRKMAEILSLLPYSLRYELDLLRYLRYQPQDFIGALISIKEQTTLWVYAYASWLFNNYLSQAAAEKKALSENLPLITSNDPAEQRLYAPWLERDNITDIAGALAPFDFIKLMSRPTPSRIFPKENMAMIIEAGVIFHFFLGKGAYATTYLMNMFKLQEGLPIPEWIHKEPGDLKKLLGLGTSAPAEERLKKYIFSQIDRANQAGQ